ncbi:PaaI family thioesterase [Stutzerimonas tarimensis]|uniref:PaaI family thioesterase n=1 Tax=Stutzerimonas tarimensis TaxID=1507735 RepID=A0ABV7T8V6_9GAMM
MLQTPTPTPTPTDLEVPPGFEPFQSTATFLTRCGAIYFNPARQVLGARIEAQHTTSYGNAHGGFLATLVDVAIGSALKRASESSTPFPTITLSVDYLSPVAEGAWIEVPVNIHRLGRQISHATCTLVEGERLVALGRAVFASVKPAPAR